MIIFAIDGIIFAIDGIIFAIDGIIFAIERVKSLFLGLFWGYNKGK